MAHYQAGKGATQDRGEKIVLQNPDDSLDVKTLRAYDSAGLNIKNSSGTTSIAIQEADGDVYIAKSLGVGTSTPDSFNDSADNLVVSEAGNGGITIATGENDWGCIYFADGTSGGATHAGAVCYNHGTDKLHIGTAGTDDRITVDSSGKVGFGVTDPDCALEILNASSSQLKLSYDADSSCTFAVDSSDNVAITPTGTGYVKIRSDLRIKEDGYIGTDSGSVLVQLDGSSKFVNVGNSGNRAGVAFSGSITRNVTAVTTTHDLGHADNAFDHVIACNSSGGAFAITLPAASTIGREIIFKDATSSAAAENVTITAAGSDTIDGAASAALASNYQSIVLVNTAAGVWSIL